VGRQSTSPRRLLPGRFRLVVALAMCLTLAVPVTGVSGRPGGVETEAVARYPGNGEQRVPASAKVYAQLRVGWFSPRSSFDIEITGSDGQRVAGHSALDATDVLSFTPERPLSPERHTVEVHGQAPWSSRDVVLDRWSFTVESAPTPRTGSGGSILLVARDRTRDAYLAEILRAEGITGFDTVSPEQVTRELLAQHAVVILGARSSTGPHIADVESWVLGGGELITMRPQGGLATLGGLTSTGATLGRAYLKIDTAEAPGAGLTAERMQIKGGALLYASAPENRIIATLSSNRRLSGSPPALALREVGHGGHIASFSYDLATSVIYTRQGSPAAAGVERDGSAPIRPNDMFMGSGDELAHLDRSRIGIPQSDEQMRLLSNLLVELHAETSPLLRFWYLPDGKKAALVMAADDHGTAAGTRLSFERMLSLSKPGCKVERWECPRATSWLYPTSSLTADEAEHYADLGFDLGAHVSTGCRNWTRESLDAAFESSMMTFRSKYRGLPDQAGHRLHCVAYSDWLGLPMEEHQWGIRLDMNFYNWPPDWIGGRPGYITGSALPMRFSTDDGRLLDVFQQETHLVNETWNGSTRAIEELITAANDERGYYGAIGTHYDFSDDFEQRLMDIAIRRDVPMVSARQLLDFTEGREASAFTNLEQTASGDLTFGAAVDPRVAGTLCGMLPVHSGERTLTSLTADGEPVDYEVTKIKGVLYAVFPAGNLRYEARYR
jgi:hypothetical protein